jgi:hypothetical protein
MPIGKLAVPAALSPRFAMLSCTGGYSSATILFFETL